MTKETTVLNLIDDTVDWINDSNLECFYEGIRTDCAIAIGIAPNSAAFRAAFGLVSISPADWARDYMVAARPWGM